jgi:hypothetical protein
MTTSKTIEQPTLEKHGLRNEFSSILVAFTDFLFDANPNELQKHWIHSIYFPLILILDRITHFFSVINFINLVIFLLPTHKKLIENTIE